MKNDTFFGRIYNTFWGINMRVKKEETIKKCYEFIELIEKAGYFIKVTDKRLFSNGDMICDFWRMNRDNVYKIALQEKDKYPLAYYLIYNRYHNKKIKLNNEEKAIELFKMIEKDRDRFLDNKCFYDGTYINTFLNNHLDYAWKIIQLRKYKKRYPNSYINIYLMKHSKVAKKTNFLLEVIEHKKSFIQTTDTYMFDNGDGLYSFWLHHKEIILYITKLDYYKNMYPTACKIIAKMSKKKKYTLDEKGLSCLEIINTKGHLLKQYDKTKLISGTVASSFIINHFDVLYRLINEDENKNKYPVAYELLREYKESNKELLSVEERCLEFYAVVEKDKVMYSQYTDKTFSDGTMFKTLLMAYRNEVYEYIMLDENKNKYPNAYKIIMDDYKKILLRKKNTILLKLQRLNYDEYKMNIEKICLDNNIDVMKNTKVIYGISYPELVSKINYLKKHGIDITDENGLLNSIFIMDNKELKKQHQISTEDLIEEYFDVQKVKILRGKK